MRSELQLLVRNHLKNVNRMLTACGANFMLFDAYDGVVCQKYKEFLVGLKPSCYLNDACDAGDNYSFGKIYTFTIVLFVNESPAAAVASTLYRFPTGITAGSFDICTSSKFEGKGFATILTIIAFNILIEAGATYLVANAVSVATQYILHEKFKWSIIPTNTHEIQLDKIPLRYLDPQTTDYLFHEEHGQLVNTGTSANLMGDYSGPTEVRLRLNELTQQLQTCMLKEMAKNQKNSQCSIM